MPNRRPSALKRAFALAAAVAGVATAVQAASLTWSGAVDNNWNLTTSNWVGAAGAAKYTAGDAVTFDDTAMRTGAITLTTVAPSSVTFNNTPATSYVLSSGAITGAATVTKNGYGLVTFNSITNTYTGSTIVNGLLVATGSTALGSTAAGTIVNSGGQLILSSVAQNENLVLSGGGLGALGNSGGALQVGGNLTYGGAITLAADASIWNAGSNTFSIPGTISNGDASAAHTLTFGGAIVSNTLEIRGVISNGANTLGITKSGGAYGSANANNAGVISLTNANTYSGATLVKVSTLGLTTYSGSTAIAGSAVNSDFTVGDSAILNIDNSGFTGSSVTRGKSLTLNGGYLTLKSQTGVANTDTFTNALTVGAGGSKITITSTSTGTGEKLMFGSLARSGAGATLFVSGTNLGTAAPGVGITNVLFGTAPTLVGGGGLDGSTTVSIIPWLVATATISGTSTSGFATYNNTNGLRLLAAGEYKTLASGNTTDDNARAAAVTIASGETRVNSLLFITSAITVSMNATSTLNIHSGAILTTASTAVIGSTATPGVLQFGEGTGEGILTAVSNGSLVINSKIATTTGGLTIGSGVSGVSLTADNTTTLSGPITVNGGTLTVNFSGSADRALGATTNTVTLNNNGKLLWNSDVTTNRVIKIGDGGGQLDASAGKTVTLTSSVTSPAGNIALPSLTKSGNASTIILNGTANSVGSISVATGTLTVATIGSQTGVLTMKAGSVAASTFTIDGGVVNDNQDAYSIGLTIRNSGTMTIVNGGVYRLNSPITDGVSAYNNPLSLGASWPGLKIGAPITVGSADVLNLTNGTMEFNGSADISVADQTSTNTVIRHTNGTLNIGANGTLNIVGNDGLHGLKVGTANPYNELMSVSGVMNVNGGTVSLTTGAGTGQTAPAFLVGVGTYGTGTNNAVGTLNQTAGSISTSGAVVLGQNGSANANLTGGTFSAAGLVSMATNSASALSVLNLGGADVSANGGLTVGSAGGNKGVGLVQLTTGTLSVNQLTANAMNGAVYKSGFLFSGGTLNTLGSNLNLGALSASDNTTGTLTTGVTTATAFRVGDGAGTAATLNLQGGSHAFTSGLVIESDGLVNVASSAQISSGAITLNGGELKYNSGTALASAITFTSGKISGTGAINTGITIGNGAILSPGNSPGSQTFAALTWTGTGKYVWETNAKAGVPGTNWDVVQVTNALDLSALTTSSKFRIDITGLAGIGDAPTAGTTTWSILNYGSMTGSFSADQFILTPSGFNGTWDDSKWSIVNVPSGGSGSLQLVYVPEPSVLAMLGLGSLLALRRRRHA